MDLPCDDESAGLSEYADTVVEAIGDRTDLVVVAQSFGGVHRTARLRTGAGRADGARGRDGPVAGRDGRGLVGQHRLSRRRLATSDLDDDGEIAVFYHDVPPALAAEALSHARDQADTPGLEPWPLDAWPDVPTRYLLCRDDRCFPAEWMRGVVRERLGIAPDEIDGGHCPALSRPKELSERLEAYRTAPRFTDS